MAISPASALEIWHRFVAERDVRLLDQLLDEEVVFKAPTYWKGRKGKAEVTALLTAVMSVFEDFEYQRQWIDGDDWALEFSARIRQLELRGVDLIHLEQGQIVDFEVMIRPPNAVEALREEMNRRLTAVKGD